MTMMITMTVTISDVTEILLVVPPLEAEILLSIRLNDRNTKIRLMIGIVKNV